MPVLSFEEYLEFWEFDTELRGGYEKYAIGINEEIKYSKERNNFFYARGGEIERELRKYWLNFLF